MIREDLEQREENTLSQYAALAKNSKGRLRESEKCEIRTEFQRDRDRILHCNSFRRLKDKTQVFLSPQGDHYRTRLTHTLEVSQIARTMARGLLLNEDLTEAIALGHDLGHTPFGHAGERALNSVFSNGFSHNIQSVRVAELLENNGRGLNLTYEVKNGIACHSDKTPLPQTLEGKLVRLADKVAYVNHDIEDAVRAGVLRAADLPYDAIYVLGHTKSRRLSTVIHSVIENSKEDIRMDSEVEEAHNKLKAYMFETVYTNSAAKTEDGKAIGIVETLFKHYLERSFELPEFYLGIANREGIERAVCDYISGMTDQFAVELYKELYIPKFWSR